MKFDIRTEKLKFAKALKTFASSLEHHISSDGQWTIKGFIDIFRNVYAISNDTKLVSKVLELHIFPYLNAFADNIGYKLELAECQNWYPDFTFILKDSPDIKFAVDLKTTYRSERDPLLCNGFTLGSHGEYFINRQSTKNVQYPYGSYAGHYCLGIIYSRAIVAKISELRQYSIDELNDIPSSLSQFIFFADEKWKIASDKGGSGNTANIGSIHCIEDILNGNGVFAKAGEDIFDEYWMNYNRIQVQKKDGSYKKLTSLPEYLSFRGLPPDLYNPRKRSGRGQDDERL